MSCPPQTSTNLRPHSRWYLVMSLASNTRITSWSWMPFQVTVVLYTYLENELPLSWSTIFCNGCWILDSAGCFSLTVRASLQVKNSKNSCNTQKFHIKIWLWFYLYYFRNFTTICSWFWRLFKSYSRQKKKTFYWSYPFHFLTIVTRCFFLMRFIFILNSIWKIFISESIKLYIFCLHHTKVSDFKYILHLGGSKFREKEENYQKIKWLLWTYES